MLRKLHHSDASMKLPVTFMSMSPNSSSTSAKRSNADLDALLLTCAQSLEADDVVIVSSDVDLNALAQLLGFPSFDPEHPES